MAFLLRSLCNTTAATDENLLSFANNIHTYEGGTHESGFKTALTRVINDYASKNGLLKDQKTIYRGMMCEKD